MIKAILIDAMSTIFRFKGELTKYEVLNRFIAELLGENLPIDRIKEVYDQKRAKFEPWPGANHLAKWTTINKAILLALFPEIEEEKAENFGKFVAKKLDSDSSLYQVNQDTLTFLKEAKKKGLRRIVASNQDEKSLQGLIKDFKLTKLLDKVYSSSVLKIEKPHPCFFRKILEEEKLLPYECVMIGNSLKNDVEAPNKVGIIGVLLDPRGLHGDYQGYKISSFKEFWHLDFFQ